MTDVSAETTVTGWKARWIKFYAWAKLHPGIVIPVTAFLLGVATPGLIKLIWRFI